MQISRYLMVSPSKIAQITFFAVTAFHPPAFASTQNVCDQAATIASQETDVPLSVLLAVTRTETGRSQSSGLEPWPWAINVNGEGSWLPTRVAAEEFAIQQFRQGQKNFDVGCFQLNFRWHGHQFGSISEMFEPVANARYAARFLSRLFTEKGNWMNAVGAFHSRTPEHSEKYKSRYSRIYSEMAQKDSISSHSSAKTRNWNQFPFLKPSGVTPLRGSLVPLGSQTNRRSLISKRGET
ncbi:transglycosylase SLT domain-containing protein [uncultured Roseobacter sp.]|uniref:transglycosylase SLT domain-containing protein n=1 Tax=uncultured Roseobacter sp. TaxID=114847 RepID=UPI00261AE520|nr:transglycosylase SLT domain-containing protein [uncultured Roseobacter sp.]